MGLDERPFQMIKFRSMRQDAEADGPGWTVENDPRVTKLGKFMRRTNWDEIPQLINVLLGDMSLVGPRPERPMYVQEFRERIPRYMERHREKSGHDRLGAGQRLARRYLDSASARFSICGTSKTGRSGWTSRSSSARSSTRFCAATRMRIKSGAEC